MADLEAAIQLFKANKLRSCEKVCQRLLKKEPASVDVLRLLKEIYSQRGDFDHLLGVYDSLVRHGKHHLEFPDWCAATVQLGAKLNRPASARRALRAILAINPADTHAQCLLAQQEFKNGKFSIAMEISESALELLLATPDQITGAQVEDIGRLAYLLSQLVDGPGAQRWSDQLSGLFDQPGLEPLGFDKNFCFALAHLCEKLGSYKESFDLYQKANTSCRLRSKYSLSQDISVLEDYRKTFTPEFMRSVGPVKSQKNTPVPIFIVGMPRSGSTLLEQILSQHSQIEGRGEVSWLLDSITQISTVNERAQNIPQQPLFDHAYFDQLRRAYFKYVKGAVSSKWFVDKMPGNVVYLWAIAQSFPEARVIHIKRDQMPTVFSCYATNFADGHHYSESLEDCKAYCELTYTLAENWKRLFGDNYKTLHYEALVLKPENEIPALLDFLGLPFEEACFQHQDSRETAQTASIMEVRKPIYKDSNRRWRNFKAYMGEIS